MSAPLKITEYRERRKPFPFQTPSGTFLLRPVSLLSLIALGSLPTNLVAIATALARKNFRSKDYNENPAAFALLIENVIVHGCAEPRLTLGEGTEEALCVGELEDDLKISLFNEIMFHTNKIEKDGEAIDLKPFRDDAGGAAAGADGADVGEKAVGTD